VIRKSEFVAKTQFFYYGEHNKQPNRISGCMKVQGSCQLLKLEMRNNWLVKLPIIDYPSSIYQFLEKWKNA